MSTYLLFFPLKVGEEQKKIRTRAVCPALALRKFFIIYIKLRYLRFILLKVLKDYNVANKFEFIFIQKSIVTNIGNFKIVPLKSIIAPRFQKLIQLLL